jgi:hypothetical protein
VRVIDGDTVVVPRISDPPQDLSGDANVPQARRSVHWDFCDRCPGRVRRVDLDYRIVVSNPHVFSDAEDFRQHEKMLDLPCRQAVNLVGTKFRERGCGGVVWRHTYVVLPFFVIFVSERHTRKTELEHPSALAVDCLEVFKVCGERG